MALYPTVADHYDLHLALCQKLQRENPHYNWVGFYWMDDADQALHLGAYVGAETDHVRIPYGRGICGQVAESGETFVVPDVNAQDNYLACSIETKAEIVVPVYKDGKLVGQLDIDSHKRDPFSPADQAYLEQVCAAVALLL
ncbi:MAG: GAF domain-containing protein [Flavobacteriia bacterium]|jgi:L-methionine (R)-S-oxide reductase|nr:GAF domain-containing protein [Flavobacteriia bacterium]NDD50939.1 GAF domain-containing protein [Flavobacteriia bacterium]NDH89868.1 GAF domain-containing protein [Flavobacteriia bacterium]